MYAGIWALLLRLIGRIIYLMVSVCCICAWSEEKVSRGKVILKKAGVKRVLCKIQMWCCLHLFYVSDTLWEEVENAAENEEQHGKERHISKATKVEKPEEVYKEQLVGCIV